MTATEPPPAGAALSSPRAAPRTIPALTGIRALAAAWVVVFHFHQMVLALLPELRPLKPLMASGFLGVDVFFLLSGFVISHNYAERLSRGVPGGYRRFVVARLARIYPTYALSLALLVAVVLLLPTPGRPELSATDLVGDLFMIRPLLGLEPWNVPAWSVTCELAAYLVFPLAAGLLVRLGGRAALAAATPILASGVVLLLLTYSPSDPAAQVTSWWIRIAVEFAVGCLLWRVWLWRLSPTSRTRSRADLAAIVAVCATVTLALAGAPAHLALPFLALFVLSTATAGGVVRAVLASRPMQWGGRISYSLYLVHFPIYIAIDRILTPADFSGSSVVARSSVVLAHLVAAIAVASMVHHLVEEPARRWIIRTSTGSSVTVGAADDTAIQNRSRPDCDRCGAGPSACRPCDTVRG